MTSLALCKDIQGTGGVGTTGEYRQRDRQAQGRHWQHGAAGQAQTAGEAQGRWQGVQVRQGVQGRHGIQDRQGIQGRQGSQWVLRYIYIEEAAFKKQIHFPETYLILLAGWCASNMLIDLGNTVGYETGITCDQTVHLILHFLSEMESATNSFFSYK